MFEIFKKIEFSNEMITFIKDLDNINWFSNVGKNPNLYLEIPFEQKKSREEVIKILKYKRNAKGIVCLENLLLEADNRSSAYLCINRKNEFNYTYNRVVKKINKNLENSKIKEISKNFQIPQQKEQINLFIDRIIRACLMDLYFGANDENYPSFFLDIFDIYKKGNTIIGWQGKFIPKKGLNTNKITKDEGNLILW